jgi:hypothetical protein
MHELQPVYGESFLDSSEWNRGIHADYLVAPTPGETHRQQKDRFCNHFLHPPMSAQSMSAPAFAAPSTPRAGAALTVAALGAEVMDDGFGVGSIASRSQFENGAIAFRASGLGRPIEAA